MVRNRQLWCAQIQSKRGLVVTRRRGAAEANAEDSDHKARLERFGAAIKRYRRLREWTHGDVEAQKGPSRKVLGIIESGSGKTPRPDTLRKLDTGLLLEPGSAAACLYEDRPLRPAKVLSVAEMELQNELARALDRHGVTNVVARQHESRPGSGFQITSEMIPGLLQLLEQLPPSQPLPPASESAE